MSSRIAHKTTKKRNEEVRLSKLSKKAMVIGATIGIAMGTAGIAAAFFTATGSGTGHAVVGTSTPLTVTFSHVTTTTLTLLPTSTQRIWLTIKNTGAGVEHFNITTTDYAFTTTGGNILTATNATAVVTGCKASWYSFVTGQKSGTLTPVTSPTHSTRATISVTVHMNNGTATHSTQDQCKTTEPKFHVTFAA